MRSPRAALLALALVASGTLGVVMLAAFVTPERPVTMREVDMGPVDAFASGSVTTFRLLDEASGPLLVREGDPFLACRPQYEGLVVHIVRQEDGAFLALDGRSGHMEELVVWRPDMQWEGMSGWFYEPCHADRYFMDGRRAFGPTARDLGSYRVSIEDGRVLVDARSHREGAWARGVTFADGSTPAPAATPWPSVTAPAE